LVNISRPNTFISQAWLVSKYGAVIQESINRWS